VSNKEQRPFLSHFTLRNPNHGNQYKLKSPERQCSTGLSEIRLVFMSDVGCEFNAKHNSRRELAPFVRLSAQKVTVAGGRIAASCYVFL